MSSSPSSLLLRYYHHHLPPRLASPAPALALCFRLRPCAAAHHAGIRCAVPDNVGDGARTIPIARLYEGALARLELSGSARREQAVAAAAAVDGGAAAKAHLAAGADYMLVEALLPGPDGGDRSAVSTRAILQAREVKEKASKINKGLGTDSFFGTEPNSDSILAMAFKQVVMEKLSNFRLDVFSPGSERKFKDLNKSQKVPVDFSIRSSDEKLLTALAEAIFSCIIEDVGKNYLGSTSGLLHTWKPKCSFDSSVCIHRISEAEAVNNFRGCLESFNLVKSTHVGSKVKSGWWPAPDCERLGKIGGPDFIVWANEFIPTYKLQINATTFKNTKLEGHHELTNNRWEVRLAHFQLAELGNVLDMYLEDQFTIPSKNYFHTHWNSDPSKIRKNNGCINNLLAFLAGSCIILFVAIIAQLCWPHSLKEKRLLMTGLCAPSSQSYCSDVYSLDKSEVWTNCMSVVKKIIASCGCPGDIMVDQSIGAWVGELPDYFKDVNLQDNAASDDIEHSSTVSQENQTPSMPSPSRTTSHVEQNGKQNIVSFQVVVSEEGKVVGLQPTSHLAVNHWATNPLAALLYEGQKLSPGFLEPRLKISHPVKASPIELLMSVNPEPFWVLARPVQNSW